MAKQQLEFLLALENSKFNRALNASQTKVAAAGKKMAAGVKPAIAGFKKLSTTIGLVGTAAAAAAGAAGLYALNSIMRESIQLAGEQESAEAKLEAVITATGGAAGLSADAMKKYASDLQSLTTYGDEVTISAMAVLATFKQIKGDEFKRSIRSAQNMAEVLNTDLNSSVLQIGKALNDPIKGMASLARAGVQFTEQQKAQAKALQESGNLVGAQKIILKELEGQFGGTADAARTTFGGAVIAAGNALGDLKEEIGFAITKNQFFVQSVALVEQQFISWTDYLKNNQGVAREYAKDVGLSILGMADAALVGFDIMYRGLNLLTGSFRGTAAASLMLAGGIFKMQQAVAYFDDAVGLTDGAVEKYRANAAAAFAAGIDLAEQAKQDFTEMADGSGKIDKARTALEGFATTMEKVGTEKIEDTSKPIEGATKAVGKHESSVEKLGGTYKKTWDDAVKDSNAFFDKAISDLNRLQAEAAKGVQIPMETVQHRAAGGLMLAAGGKLAGYGGGDRIPALLEAGEYIIRKEAVSRFGAGIFHALNSLRLPALPGFATGGPVGAGAGGGGQSVTINLYDHASGEQATVVAPTQYDYEAFERMQRKRARLASR